MRLARAVSLKLDVRRVDVGRMPDTQQPILPGQLLVEVVGAEVRFWRVKDCGKRAVQIARSFAYFGQRTMQRMGAPEVVGEIVAAPELTVARVYDRKDRQKGLARVLAFFPEHRGEPVHFFHAGNGPSGNLAFAGSRFTVQAV